LTRLDDVHAAFEAGGESAEATAAGEDLALQHHLAIHATQLRRRRRHLRHGAAGDARGHVHASLAQQLRALVLVHVQPTALRGAPAGGGARGGAGCGAQHYFRQRCAALAQELTAARVEEGARDVSLSYEVRSTKDEGGTMEDDVPTARVPEKASLLGVLRTGK
jgi:hypothetical protein